MSTAIDQGKRNEQESRTIASARRQRAHLMMTAGEDTGYLAELARSAHETAGRFGDALVSLRNAIDRGDRAEMFGALGAFEQASAFLKGRADDVVDEAIRTHGYY